MAKPTTKKIGDKPVPISRREEVRRALPKESFDWKGLLDQPGFYLSLGIGLLFVMCVSMVAMWASYQPMARDGQIMFETFAARVDFQVVDSEKTRTEKERARQSAPRVYREIESRTESLEALLNGLPKAVAGTQAVSELPADLVQQFDLTEDVVVELRSFLGPAGEPTDEWKEMVHRFTTSGLYEYPIIDAERYAKEVTSVGDQIELIVTREGQQHTFKTNKTKLINVTTTDDINRQLGKVIRTIFPGVVQSSVLAGIRNQIGPTFQFDDTATTANQLQAERNVPPQLVKTPKGTVLYRAGEPITADQVSLLKAEHEQYVSNASTARIWAERFGVIGLILLVSSVMGGCIGMFRSKLFRKPLRLLVLAMIVVSLLAISAAVTSALPSIFLGISLATTLLLAVILVVAYGRPMALGMGSLYGVLVCITLPIPVGYLGLMVGALGLNIWQLREIRDRNRLLRAGAVTGLGAAAGAAALAFVYRPITADGFGLALLIDMVGAAAAGLFVGIFMLGILSSIERLFNVTTGLTLVELRDPKQPLLRQLLERAPGTWNHSLQVANIAEAAADAIRADSLLTYVGALYHDIGKMNKPSYFVENQTDGENRHAKLSPAMSLLIIVGHVKDGIEMAREFGLPKCLHHFIEAHHGTTLVEYFYHVAKEKAESGETHDDVKEVEYRYPGPKPQTKEVAILMIADAVESAARALPEKAPSRIEQLVRSIGQKRLLDGQFDQCDLTLRELHLVEDSIIKSLNAMYHGRVSYPAEPREEPEENPVERQPQPQTA